MPRKESTQWRFCLSKFHKQHTHTHMMLLRGIKTSLYVEKMKTIHNQFYELFL